MKPLAQVQWIASVLLAGSVAAVCQSSLPPMAPTMRDVEEHTATVEYSDGRIAVVADNSSLNEILRDVARRAGMAVEGSVIEERVFGKYGPAAPAEVLSALLVGTGSNMMVIASASHAPQLILTPKHGNPTPPNPRADEERARAEAELIQQREAAEEAAEAVASAAKPAASDAGAATEKEADPGESRGESLNGGHSATSSKEANSPAVSGRSSDTPEQEASQP